jgi:hypothetical protein
LSRPCGTAIISLKPGQGTFEDNTRLGWPDYSGHSSGTVIFDFNRDGLLDLFVCNVGKYTTDQIGPGGYYIGFTNGFSGHLFPERTERSILYRNLGSNKFKDVTQEAGLLENAWTGDATFTDLNQDGFPDLYVLNMQGDDHFYENAGGRFVEKTAVHFPKTPWGAMGVKFLDYNRDGFWDLFVTDMHSDMTGPQTRVSKTDFDSLEKQKRSMVRPGH